MSKMVQAFLSGVFFTFILDFFIFLTIQQNYIIPYEIDVYYNILFVDNQNIFLFIFLSLIFGYMIIYIENKISLIVLTILSFVVALSLFIPSFGKFIGSSLLMQKNQLLTYKSYKYNGDILYNGRKNISFYDYKLKKVIILQKKDLVQ